MEWFTKQKYVRKIKPMSLSIHSNGDIYLSRSLASNINDWEYAIFGFDAGKRQLILKKALYPQDGAAKIRFKNNAYFGAIYAKEPLVFFNILPPKTLRLRARLKENCLIVNLPKIKD